MPDLHSWIVEPAEAIRLQSVLRQRLVLAWDGRELETVGGVDMSVKGETARAAVIVLSYPDLALLESATAEVPLEFPYIPGLLTFREGPAILAAWQRLKTVPDLLMFDGQGIAHPRGIGIAAHMGLWLDRPSIGVAKSWLYGAYTAPGSQRGNAADLRDPHDPTHLIGQVLRTRTDVKPVYVSPGHLIDVSHSVELVLACCTRYRLPEPTRRAHQVAGGTSVRGQVLLD